MMKHSSWSIKFARGWSSYMRTASCIGISSRRIYLSMEGPSKLRILGLRFDRNSRPKRGTRSGVRFIWAQKPWTIESIPPKTIFGRWEWRCMKFWRAECLGAHITRRNWGKQSRESFASGMWSQLSCKSWSEDACSTMSIRGWVRLKCRWNWSRWWASAVVWAGRSEKTRKTVKEETASHPKIKRWRKPCATITTSSSGSLITVVFQRSCSLAFKIT